MEVSSSHVMLILSNIMLRIWFIFHFKRSFYVTLGSSLLGLSSTCAFLLDQLSVTRNKLISGRKGRLKIAFIASKEKVRWGHSKDQM